MCPRHIFPEFWIFRYTHARTHTHTPVLNPFFVLGALQEGATILEVQRRWALMTNAARRSGSSINHTNFSHKRIRGSSKRGSEIFLGEQELSPPCPSTPPLLYLLTRHASEPGWKEWQIQKRFSLGVWSCWYYLWCLFYAVQQFMAKYLKDRTT